MDQRDLTLLSLRGLSIGDAFGEMFFRVSTDLIQERKLPTAPWRWTDDTHMALSIVDTLFEHGETDPDFLAQRFAARYKEEPWRGYAGGAADLLASLLAGESWRRAAPALFDGGSYGNGGAMRAAPIGAYFYADPERAAKEAQKSALVTHAHLEGQAGAMAVAIAAATFASEGTAAGSDWLSSLLPLLPHSITRARIRTAAGIAADQYATARQKLGTGQQVAAFDTVPFCLWVAAHHAQDFENALWTTVQGLGDRDTTCAILGGIIGPHRPIPEIWLLQREPLPEGYEWDGRTGR